VTVFISQDIVEEVRHVLSLPELQNKFSMLTEVRVKALLERLEEDAILIHNVPETFRYTRDPADEMYINLALVTGARYLVTYDNDLLALMRESKESLDFQHRFPLLRIVEPLTFLEFIGLPYVPTD
jgi:putative PIN family toxin of toxin-antitoxin system